MAKGNSSIREIRKKVTKAYELISSAHHESAHTIYALLHLMKVSSVVIFENKKLKRIHGHTCYDYPHDIDLIQDLDIIDALIRADIGMCYAGLIAEKTLFKSISGSRQIPMFISDGSTDDNKCAHEIIKKYNLALPGPKRALFKKKIIREVQCELNLYWDDVTIIAHSLFQRRSLTYQDLQNLLTKKSINKKFWKERFKKVSYFHDSVGHLDKNDIKIILSQ
jgi:hypothetical protein